MTYVFVGPHPDALASGTPLSLDVVVGDDQVNLDDPHDRRLIDEGWLLEHIEIDTSSTIDSRAVAETVREAARDKAAEAVSKTDDKPAEGKRS